MKRLFILLSIFLLLSASAFAQALGTAGSISGVVTDPNGAVVSGATVTLSNSLTGYSRTVTTTSDGSYRFNDIPPNNYSLKIAANVFREPSQSIVIRSTVPMTISVALALAGTTETVDINANETIVENVPTTHVDVDASEFQKLPISSPGNGLSDAITMKSPGVVADS